MPIKNIGWCNRWYYIWTYRDIIVPEFRIGENNDIYPILSADSHNWLVKNVGVDTYDTFDAISLLYLTFDVPSDMTNWENYISLSIRLFNFQGWIMTKFL